MRFKEHVSLCERDQEDEKLAVFTFGRFNPPTRGHGKIFEAVYRLADERGGEPFIFASPVVDKKSNPLDYGTKTVFMETLFPDVKIVLNETIRSPFHATGFLGENGFTNVLFVVGSDRVEEFTKRFSRAGDYFKSFEVVSAGERDPEAPGIAGMSGTKAREAAITEDIGKFRAATGWSGEVAEQLMRAVRAGLLKE